MFKSTENPAMELMSSEFELIKKSLHFANINRITRVIIHSKSILEFYEIDKIAAAYPDISIWVKIDATYVNSPIKKYDNIEIIVCTTQDYGINYDNHDGFWKMDLDVNELPNEEFLDNEMIIWHLQFKRKFWDEFDSQIYHLLNGYTTHDLMIDNVLLSIDLIKEHPCNVYLCRGTHCHSQHGNIPRCIFVDSKGNMYPYGITHNSLLMGNIFSETDIISEYGLSNEKKQFINMNRNLYLSIIDKCNYSLIPWFEILGGEITSDC